MVARRGLDAQPTKRKRKLDPSQPTLSHFFNATLTTAAVATPVAQGQPIEPPPPPPLDPNAALRTVIGALEGSAGISRIEFESNSDGTRAVVECDPSVHRGGSAKKRGKRKLETAPTDVPLTEAAVAGTSGGDGAACEPCEPDDPSSRKRDADRPAWTSGQCTDGCGDDGRCMPASEGVASTPPSPPKPLVARKVVRGQSRTKGELFVDKHGTFRRWSGRVLLAACTPCVLVGDVRVANYADEDGTPRRLCSKHAREAGTHEVQKPCRDCPDVAKLQANYADEDGTPMRLCSKHAREAGTYEVQNPCRDCPGGAKLEASYSDEEGHPSRLCSQHAREAGTHEVRQPCRDCPEGAKLQANYADEEGTPRRLCSQHAREAGTHEVLNPCRDCPGGAKLEASYSDEEGHPSRLCSQHAREAGTHEVRQPCRDCPEGAKLQANYADEEGTPRRLCSQHAREAGTHEVLNPCRDCPDGSKLQASYADEEGTLGRLCSKHAVKAGTHVDTGHTGGSYEACQCFCRLERALGVKLPHIHYLLGGGHEGSEQQGLLPNRPRMTPDSFRPDPSGKSRGFVYQYHGNGIHGYPPDHPKHFTWLRQTGLTKWGPDAYWATVAKDELYVEAGYRVFRVWAHEFKECLRAHCPRDVREVVEEVVIG